MCFVIFQKLQGNVTEPEPLVRLKLPQRIADCFIDACVSYFVFLFERLNQPVKERKHIVFIFYLEEMPFKRLQCYRDVFLLQVKEDVMCA